MKRRILLAIIVMLAAFAAPASALAASAAPTCTLANPCCYAFETAWADGVRYLPYPMSNWATYTPYEGVEKTVTLYAGQTMDAGTVTFSAPEDGFVTIEIRTNPGWRFFGRGSESIHIEDYMDTPPHQNPAPGQFTYKFTVNGFYFITHLPVANFYGVHVSLIHNVPCTKVGPNIGGG